MSLPRASTVVFLLLLGCLMTPAAHAASDAPVRRGQLLGLQRQGAPSDTGMDETRDTIESAPPDADSDAARNATDSAPPDAAAGNEARNTTLTPVSAADAARDTTASPEPFSPGGTRLPGMSGVPAQSNGEDLPLSPEAWVAHGGLTLLPLAGIWGASRVGGDTRLTSTASETASGMLLGALPARLLFFRPATPSSGRWTELEVVAFGGGLVLTPPLAALGTWGLGELAFGGSRDRGDAYLGALGGAAVGALLGVAVHGVLTKLAGPSARLKSERQLIGLAFIGAGATVGYQWAGGGPRPDEHTR